MSKTKEATDGVNEDSSGEKSGQRSSVQIADNVNNGRSRRERNSKAFSTPLYENKPVKKKRAKYPVKRDGKTELPPGWTRKVVERQSGKTAGKLDVYFFSPDGKKIRSGIELERYVEKNQLDVDIDIFDFTTTLDEPHEKAMDINKKKPLAKSKPRSSSKKSRKQKKKRESVGKVTAEVAAEEVTEEGAESDTGNEKKTTSKKRPATKRAKSSARSQKRSKRKYNKDEDDEIEQDNDNSGSDKSNDNDEDEGDSSEKN